MGTKSLLSSAFIDKAQKAHNCQANARHRVNAGDVRLKVKNGRSWNHYCKECAKIIIDRDTAKLIKLSKMEVTIEGI